MVETTKELNWGTEIDYVNLLGNITVVHQRT